MRSLWRPLLAEGIGCFLYTVLIAGAILSQSYEAMLKQPGVGLLGLALVHGSVVALLIAAIGPMSGGHFNPAVTLAMLLLRRVDIARGIGYICMQCAGAILAAELLRAFFSAAVWAPVNLGGPRLGIGVEPWSGLGLETLLSAIFLLIAYLATLEWESMTLVGAVAGLLLFVETVIGQPLTGAAVNPARVLGSALVSGQFAYLQLYLVAPLLGALIAVAVYHVCLRPVERVSDAKNRGNGRSSRPHPGPVDLGS